ncbi:hypothetical protein Tco_0470138, partial [Tanacetum coccineum]
VLIAVIMWLIVYGQCMTVPRVFDEPLSNSDSMSRSSETSDLFEELIVEISLDDSIPIGIDDSIVTY